MAAHSLDRRDRAQTAKHERIAARQPFHSEAIWAADILSAVQRCQ
jgi:hypothetical protein